MSNLNLTINEKKLLNGTRTNNFSDIYESGGDWTFGVIDAANMNAKQARGVISSLIQKGLIYVYGKGNDSMLSLTGQAKKLFEEADGKENTGWGGPKLLRED